MGVSIAMETNVIAAWDFRFRLVKVRCASPKHMGDSFLDWGYEVNIKEEKRAQTFLSASWLITIWPASCYMLLLCFPCDDRQYPLQL